jgi:hypothetical protein
MTIIFQSFTYRLLPFTCVCNSTCIEVLVRVLLPDGNARKLDTAATGVAQLYNDIATKIVVKPTESFLLHYFDKDFGDYFTLESDDCVQDKMTIKIVDVVADSAVYENKNSDTVDTPTPCCSASVEEPKLNLRKQDIVSGYSLPTFDPDLEAVLNGANANFNTKGVLTTLSHGVKSRILTRLTSDIFENYTAYPSTTELEIVAKALVKQYEGIKDSGKGFEGWLNSLIFKTGNYRTLMR